MKKYFLIILFMTVIISDIKSQQINYINPEGSTISTRIIVPKGFERTREETGSYGQYLRNLPLKKDGAKVLYYDGSEKENYNVYVAVVKQEIGNRDLHQCADAVMRVRADYLWKNGRYEDIHFNFTNGWRADYSKWMEGKRIRVSGNRSYWIDATSPSNSYSDYWKYMQMIFAYAGSLSLSKELVYVDIKDLKIGDVFIQGGSPGHAIAVVDMAVNKRTNEKIFLLAQSFMPAQEFQVLDNNNGNLGPWYSDSFSDILYTPEWTFNKSDLMRFSNN